MSKEERIQEIRELIERGGFVCNADAKFLLSELPQTVAETDLHKIIGDLGLMAALCDQPDIADAIRKVRKKLAERIHSSAPDTKGLDEHLEQALAQWKLYASSDGETDLAHDTGLEAELYQAGAAALTSYRERK